MLELSVDHRPTTSENPEECERLSKANVRVTEDGYVMGRVAVSRAFGDLARNTDEKLSGLIATPDIQEVALQDQDEFVLLGCDGIFEVMGCRDAMLTVRRKLRAGATLEEAADEVVQQAFTRGSSDNLSVVIVLLKRPAPIETSSERPRLRFFNSKLAAPK
mmetsp:Transcript_87363/g.233905  ORF Transcript_87363/g.233905 Transcript_87363/m.233905 type:complete len:161 (-) Transcript_87363:66-548(-)